MLIQKKNKNKQTINVVHSSVWNTVVLKGKFCGIRICKIPNESLTWRDTMHRWRHWAAPHSTVKTRLFHFRFKAFVSLTELNFSLPTKCAAYTFTWANVQCVHSPHMPPPLFLYLPDEWGTQRVKVCASLPPRWERPSEWLASAAS